MDEPIFWSVVDDMRAAGYDVPWRKRSKGWMASWLMSERAGMAVMNPRDAVKIVNPA